jgi:sporulation protein YlmC with PRC-barrel domain
MSYLDRDTYGMYKDNEQGPGPALMGANTLTGDDVYNTKEEKLGDIKEIMLDVETGKIAYAVLSYGGVFTLGEKLFAVPWSALKLDTVNKRFILDIGEERIRNAPGFDKDRWPNMADPEWSGSIHSFYGAPSYKMP